MATSSLLKSAVVGAALMASSSLWAVECSEVVWSSSVLAQYPNISDLCQGVVERDGKQYVEVQGKFVRMHDNKARIKFKHADGSYGKTFESKELPNDYKITVNGKEVLLHRVQRDTQLTIYLPPDRFTLISDLAVADTSLDMVEVPPEMPSTASWTPLLGLLGALGCGLGLVMTSLRRLRRRN
ncbi:MAG: hypothetical protein K0Q78_2048 [Cellvibrio sp.]|jgi:hypothetical protein|nr:hypothetical protein [Cellvibrio sp.]